MGCDFRSYLQAVITYISRRSLMGGDADHAGTRLKPLVDLNNQTVEYPPGSGVRYLATIKDGQIRPGLDPNVRTIYESMRHGAKFADNGRGPCLGKRDLNKEGMPYVWTSYEEAIATAESLAAGFRSKGVEPGEDSRIGIYASNCPEWIITEQATYVYSMVNVPLYDTLGPDACSYIIKQAGIRLVVAGSSAKALTLLEQDSPTLATLVLIEKPSDALVKKAGERHVDLVTFEDLVKDGATLKFKWPAQPPEPSSVATICYTSGTTGPPKGVVLTHENLIANTCCITMMPNSALSKDEVMISYLPLAHMFERLLETAMYTMGAQVGFFRGDVKLLTEDLKALRPSVFPTVPRLLNRIYDKVKSDVNKSMIKRKIFEYALAAKIKQVKSRVIRNDTFWDKLVFSKIQAGIGGRVRMVITGAAPCSPDVLDFARAAFGCYVIEGYGQTESAAGMTVTLEGDSTSGTVGVPFPCCGVRLDDIPEMQYYSKNNQGEICCKGKNVFREYFGDPEKTQETLDADGWLHTGDVGEWTKMGTLKIIDRKKHIFKLNQGEYVAPEKVENVYQGSKYIEQAFVYGDSLKSACVAIVVPDGATLPGAVAKELSIPASTSMKELCEKPEVKKLILADMAAAAKKAGLHSFEQAKDIFLSAEPWSVDNGLLTPTFKSKRPELLKTFKGQIDAMYAHID